MQLGRTSEREGVSEGAHVRVGQLAEQRDDGAHQVAVEDDGVLTLSHQDRHEFRELGVEPATVRSRLHEGVLGTVLQGRGRLG